MLYMWYLCTEALHTPCSPLLSLYICVPPFHSLPMMPFKMYTVPSDGAGATNRWYPHHHGYHPTEEDYSHIEEELIHHINHSTCRCKRELTLTCTGPYHTVTKSITSYYSYCYLQSMLINMQAYHELLNTTFVVITKHWLTIICHERITT